MTIAAEPEAPAAGAVREGSRPNGQAARIFAVVATYRRPDVARQAIEALRTQTRPPDGIILVENSPERDFDGEYDPSFVELVHTGRNTGAAGGFGIGTEVALERGATHVTLVDDDCILAPDVIEGIERAVLEQVPGAVVGPIVVTPEEDALVWDIYTPSGKPYAGPDALPDYPIPTRDLAFHGLTASAEALRVAGGPRADLFFGGPDVEFSLRLAHHGHAIFYLPQIRARHHATNYHHFWFLGKRKVPAGTPGHRYYVLRNRLLMWRMYHRDPVSTGIVKVIAREVIGALLSTDRIARLRLLGRAIREAATGDPRRPLDNAVPLR